MATIEDAEVIEYEVLDQYLDDWGSLENILWVFGLTSDNDLVVQTESSMTPEGFWKCKSYILVDFYGT